jgi:hypothetical protein
MVGCRALDSVTPGPVIVRTANSSPISVPTSVWRWLGS